MSKSEIVKADSAQPGLLSIIERVASSPDADIDKLERMLDMQERVMNRESLMAYNSAMAGLQSEMPTITKNGEIAVNGTVRSKYAKFEDINEAIRPLLNTFGFSVSFKSNFNEGMLDISGTISHIDGHSESTTMRLPFDTSGSKNGVQAIGSSVSYGKRYVLCMLLNISVSDEDTDGVVDNMADWITIINNCKSVDDFNTVYADARSKGMVNKLKANFKAKKKELSQ